MLISFVFNFALDSLDAFVSFSLFFIPCRFMKIWFVVSFLSLHVVPTNQCIVQKIYVIQLGKLYFYFLFYYILLLFIYLKFSISISSYHFSNILIISDSWTSWIFLLISLSLLFYFLEDFLEFIFKTHYYYIGTLIFTF